MFFSKKELVGLDIGSNTIKLVELRSGRRGYQLKNIGQIMLPQDSIVDKIIKDHDTVVEAVSNLIDDLRVKTKNVAISISGHSVVIKKVSLPRMSDKELRESIPWELEQYIPQSINDVHYDYQVMPGESPEGNIDVLIVAAKKDVTNSYVSVVKEAGLNPVVVDVDAFALENTYEINYPDSDGLLALVNIGASVTNVSIIHEGLSVFSRDITKGGNQLTEVIMKKLDLGYEEVEKLKFSPLEDDAAEELSALAREFNELISWEIKRTLDSFSSSLLAGKVDNIFICGGSSKIPGLKDVLSHIMDTKVDILNPFNVVTYDKDYFDPEYIESLSPKVCVAMGLALRKPGDKG